MSKPDISKNIDSLYTSPERVQKSAENVHGELITALAQCRDAFPAPEIDSDLDHWLLGAIADPLGVPGYVRASAEALRKELEQQRTEAKNWKRWCEEAEAKAQIELERVKGERYRLVGQLVLIKKCLEQANEQENGPISGTIWFGPAETLFDYIDGAIAAQGEGA